MMALNAENITDDAMVMEQFGHAKVKFIEGDYKNIKVTTPEDISVNTFFVICTFYTPSHEPISSLMEIDMPVR